jgi:hypothetical protein
VCQEQQAVLLGRGGRGGRGGFTCPLIMMVEGVGSATGMTDSGTAELKVMDSEGYGA